MAKSKNKVKDLSEPQEFCWVIPGRLSTCERPGGRGRKHNQGRLQSELAFLKSVGVTTMVSLLMEEDNLKEYQDAGLRYRHFPIRANPPRQSGLIQFEFDIDQMIASQLPPFFDYLDRALSDVEGVYCLHLDGGRDTIGVIMASYFLHSGRANDSSEAREKLEKAKGYRITKRLRVISEFINKIKK